MNKSIKVEAYQITDKRVMAALMFCSKVLSTDETRQGIMYLQITPNGSNKIQIIGTNGRQMHIARINNFGLGLGGLFSLAKGKRGNFLVRCPNEDIEFPDTTHAIPDEKDMVVYELDVHEHTCAVMASYIQQTVLKETECVMDALLVHKALISMPKLDQTVLKVLPDHDDPKNTRIVIESTDNVKSYKSITMSLRNLDSPVKKVEAE